MSDICRGARLCVLTARVFTQLKARSGSRRSRYHRMTRDILC
ncbi:hypothetical protein [Scytonema millei]|nr:hypothetical protein [Scytonema millei]